MLMLSVFCKRRFQKLVTSLLASSFDNDGKSFLMSLCCCPSRRLMRGASFASTKTDARRTAAAVTGRSNREILIMDEICPFQ